MTAFPIEGGCLCGRIRYRIDERPLSAGICHCRSCRRAAGAESVAWAVIPVRSFHVLRGKPAAFGSSPGVTRTFCDRCGTSLTFQESADTIDVTLASLDDPELLPPTRESWLEHRLSWNARSPDLQGDSRGDGGETA